MFASVSGLCAGAVFVCALSLGTVAQAQESASNPADLTRFDVLNIRGWAIPHPSVADTLVGDAGGVRSTLADAGLGFYGILGPNLFIYDLTQSNQGKPRAVNGQVGTWSNAYESLGISYDLGKVGLEGGQLNLVAFGAFNSLQQVNGPDYVRIRELVYNQYFADGKIFLEAGYDANEIRFIGNFVGGSLAAGTLGPQAFIPFEVGLSYAGYGAASADIKFDLGDGIYDRAAVQRSVLPPANGSREVRVNPNPGLKFAPPGAGALFIDELGYQKASSPSQASIWLRAGGLYNTTQYPSFIHGEGMHNWAVYVLGDRQLTFVDRVRPYRGLYIGASVMYAPPLQNLFSQYYEVRAYQNGPFDARPEDFASVVVSYETYSKEGGRALSPPPLGAFANTTTAIGAYAFHVRSGIYVQPGLGYVVHPSVSRLYSNEFNAYLNLTAYF